MSVKGLRISTGVVLPLDAVTRTHGLLAMRGAGKSNAAVVLAEEMYDARLPWVAIDPKGDWWGIRSSGDGKGAGLEIPVFGGLRGDLPLEPTEYRIRVWGFADSPKKRAEKEERLERAERRLVRLQRGRSE